MALMSTDVIGSAVNVASRLEATSKEKDVQIVISRDVARQAGWEPPAEMISNVAVRGLSESLEVIAIGRGRDLPVSILASADDEAAGEGVD